MLKLTDFADRHTLEPGPNSSSQNNNNSGRNSLQASDLKDDLPLKAEKIVEEKIAPKELDFGPVPATPDGKLCSLFPYQLNIIPFHRY